MHMVNEQGEDENEPAAGADRIDKNKQSIIKLFFLYTHWKEKSTYLVRESRNMANLTIQVKKKEESGHLCVVSYRKKKKRHPNPCDRLKLPDYEFFGICIRFVIRAYSKKITATRPIKKEKPPDIHRSGFFKNNHGGEREIRTLDECHPIRP